MKKSLVTAMLCMALSAAVSAGGLVSSQAPPGAYAATSNKSGGVKEVNNQQPAFGGNLAPDGKTFVLTPVGLGVEKVVSAGLMDARCPDSKGQGSSSCILPTVWRPAVDKIKAPPLVAGIFDKNYTGAHLPETSLGEPPGAAVLI